MIIDPESIVEQLESTKAKIAEAKKAKKQILVVCEKDMYAEEIATMAKKAGFHYLNQKLPAGFLTNFSTLTKTIGSMNEKKKYVASEAFSRLTKKEQVMITRDLAKIERIYEGVKNLKAKPDLVVVIDGSLSKGIVKELAKTKIDNVVLASTDFDIWWDESSLLMMNMQSYTALDFAMKYIFA